MRFEWFLWPTMLSVVFLLILEDFCRNRNPVSRQNPIGARKQCNLRCDQPNSYLQIEAAILRGAQLVFRGFF